MGWNFKGFGWYRCGWARKNMPLSMRFGKYWVWIGPYAIGNVRGF